MQKEELRFADDRPISLPTEDLLNRSSFSRALALAIASWRQQDSLVIGLTGSWGSGKSSIKNLALQHLAITSGAEVVEFNPWEWAGQDKLISVFFDEVSRAVQRKDSSKAGKELAKTFRRYGRRLSAGANLITGTAKVVPALLGSALVVSALGSLADGQATQVALWALSAVGWLGGIAPFLKNVAEKFIKGAEGIDQQAKDDELTLGEIRQELQKLLKAREKPLLIVLDDLDRLSSEQLKAMFQLVKANMDFANVVFLLIFQRGSVEQGLQRAGFDDSADYLEKIIQVPFSVPAIAGARLEQILFNRLDAILSSEPQLQKRFDQDYWSGMFSHGMRPFFSNLRSVYRYASTLAFHCRLLRGSDVAEVNPVDLFALECLRVFAPATYASLPPYKASLTGSQVFARNNETERTRLKQIVEELVKLAPISHQAATIQIIKQLFPTLDWVFSNTRHGGETYSRWLANSRVCCAEVFDRYFELSLPTDGIPNSLLHRLVNQITNHDAFCSELDPYDAATQGDILSRLEGFVEDFPLSQSLEVVKTLLRVGEVVSGRGASLSNWSPAILISRLLRQFLHRHPQEATRSHLLLEAFTETKGLVIGEALLGGEDALRRTGDVGDLDDAGMEMFKRAFIKALLDIANADPDAFLSHWNLISFAYRLNRYADGEGKRWINMHINTSERFLLFAQAALSTGNAYLGNTTSQFHFVSVRTIEDLMGIDECARWVTLTNEIELLPTQSLAIEKMKEALERRRLGKDSEYD
ncbi:MULTISPECIES: KAP family P-loop NTPase fold protein [Pseudomonas]|uniref:KAP NTPase domain-containing protein n=1 Tax=Pseudomonas quercus TaxID=2722792 RepID=A0ABX0YG59_9PSED|nr:MULTISPECIES: P-loop NTPase fold protein [Pseudomonas]MBF7143071.1 NTPase [Pseudomonas sp. LY10J]NJP01900.1 hypothetical protein [Pseudomonas quercus]